MRTLDVIEGGLLMNEARLPQWSLPGRRLTLIHALRSTLLVTVFILAIIFQLLQGEFLSTSIWLPVYGLLMISFSLNSFYFLFSEWFEGRWAVHAAMFAMDAALITALSYYTGATKSIFFFLYLVNIILTGLVFQRRGAFTMALWTSLLFSGLLLLSPHSSGENIYFLASLNNVAFFALAYLSGNLSEQIDFVGAQLTRTTRDLERLQDLNKLIVENIGTGLITVDDSGQIVTANSAAEKILDGIHLVGKQINYVFPALNLAANVVSLRGTEEGIRRQDLEFLNHRKERLAIEAVISPLKDDQGQGRGHVVLFQDSTEIKRLEAAMRQKEKLAAVGQLAAGIAHEIRNPLASLSGSVQLMAASPEKHSAEDLKLMRIITREIDRLNELISEFLEYVRPEVRADQKVDLNKVIREVLEMVRFNPQMKKEMQTEARLKAKCLILGHHDKLKQAFLNIVINAVQAMEKIEHPHLDIETVDVADRVVVIIKDNGLGMNEVTLQRLFEPFYTTKPKGTGLGLAVTHKIFENHGARVQVQSVEGQGTTFTIDFPGERDHYLDGVPELKRA